MTNNTVEWKWSSCVIHIDPQAFTAMLMLRASTIHAHMMPYAMHCPCLPSCHSQPTPTFKAFTTHAYPQGIHNPSLSSGHSQPMPTLRAFTTRAYPQGIHNPCLPSGYPLEHLTFLCDTYRSTTHAHPQGIHSCIYQVLGLCCCYNYKYKNR